MNKSSIFRSILVVASTLFLFASCDKDFNEIDSDVIGEDHFDFLPDSLSTVVAYNQKTGVVQSNNKAINSLGIYHNPVFGKTKANFVTDLQLSTVNPIFDDEKFVSLDSVVLSIPYSSRKTATATDGKVTYELDSIYGSGPISLKIFESGYVLNDLDPGTPGQEFQNAQKYYTNENSKFDAAKKVLLYENSAFLPSDKEIITYKRDKGLVINQEDKVPENIEARLTPRIRVKLNKDFFMSKIINAPEGKLVNNSVFKEYFRGLYFQVQDANTGTLMQLKFTDGDVTLHYTEYATLEDADNNPDTPKTPVKFPADDTEYPNVEKKSAKTLVLKMAGNTVNLFENDYNTDYLNAISSSNTVAGDKRLYVKGGEGSMVVVKLFGSEDNIKADGSVGSNGVSDELDRIRLNGWLINEANLTFYVENTDQGMNPIGAIKAEEPQRLFLFNLDNNKPLIDFNLDTSVTQSFPKFNKYVHDGLIQREKIAGGRGLKYRVRITNHIRNLVRNDSTNVRLGLVVTESIENIVNAKLDTQIGEGANKIDRIPQASVMNPFGTILWGNTADVPQEKKLKLEIYYTKPN